MFKRKQHFILTLLCVLYIALLSGCSSFTNKEIKEKTFQDLTNRIFTTEVQQDTLTLNFSLANPSSYGIEETQATFGKYSVKSIQDSLIRTENYLNSMEKFPYEELSESEQLTYDILKQDLELDLELSEHILFTEILGPTTGIQAQLPILLAEYNFYTKNDIHTYLELLPQVYSYFKDIIEFEKEKSKAGLFMNDQVADNIINQCNSFIAQKENNYLIEIFNDRIRSFQGLSSKEIESYSTSNKEAVLKYIIPAYELLVKELTSLKGSGKNELGLAHYDGGKEYYEFLIKSRTGSTKSVDELKSMLEKSIHTNLNKLSSLVSKDNSVYVAASNPVFKYTDPNEITEYLKKNLTRDFPDPPDVNYSIKYVHESLEEHLSPAMYLIPAVDSYMDNTIYINGNPSYDLTKIFPTIAHEGYPGHLYQSVYFRDKNPDPIRNLLSFGGYVEGWATYVEYYSYYLSGVDTNVASFLEASMSANLALYCMLDIGIHYDGWTMEDTKKYLSDYGLEDSSIVELLYTTMLDEPALYPQYGVGYLEVINLRNIAKKELGDNFVAKDFNTFLLDIGPAQFNIIEDRLHKWIK